MAATVAFMRLEKMVRAQAELLGDVFGEDAYEIVADEDNEVVRVRTAWMDVLLAFDFRDQFVSSSVKPLRVPDELSEDHTTDTLLRFLDIDVGIRRKSVLDEQQVRDELNLMRPLVELLKNERSSRDATWFVNGYNAAYTDYCSGKW